jgi:hypothetical protein
MKNHLSNDELLDRLYGLAGEAGHIESCTDCQQRWNQLREQRARLAVSDDVSTGFLAGQRRKIYARLGEEPRHQMKWAPALAAACLLVAGVFLYRPAAAPHQSAVVSDAQLFSDVYSMEQSVEPRAAEPIHALFEDNQ